MLSDTDGIEQVWRVARMSSTLFPDTFRLNIKYSIFQFRETRTISCMNTEKTL